MCPITPDQKKSVPIKAVKLENFPKRILLTLYLNNAKVYRLLKEKAVVVKYR